MSNKRITIVINTFNSEDKIHKCIGSIPNEYKIIVIENSKNEIILDFRFWLFKC